MTARDIDHTAIVVHDLDEAIDRYQRLFGAQVTDRRDMPEQQVEVAFLGWPGSQLELMQPCSTTSGIGRFLERNGEALHHICFLVENVSRELEGLAADGVELIDSQPRQGVHGRIAFIHPRGTGGVLVELLEREGPGQPY